MKIKLLLKTVFLAACFSMAAVNAQTMKCTPTPFSDVTIINQTGGEGTNDGLRIELSGSGNLQVKKNKIYQIYSGSISEDFFPTASSPYNYTGTQGMVLTIGSNVFKTGNIDPSSFTPRSVNLPISLSSCVTNTTEKKFDHIINFKAEKNNLSYYLTVTYSYTFPNNFFTIKYEVTIPSGNTEVVKLSQGWDTKLAGGDSGPGFVSGAGANLTMGTQKKLDNQEVVYEAFKYKSGKPWDGYYSGYYLDMESNLKNNGFIFNKTIDSNERTDNGIGISINYGSVPGTYSTTNDVIFKCNAPTEAPKFSNTNLSIDCGSSINLKAGYTGTAEFLLPAGVTLDFYDAQGNKVANPTAVTTPGTYTVLYSDANNAGCTSPSTILTVTKGSCCSKAPVLTSNTINNGCPGDTANLNSLYSGTLPSGVVLEWYNNNTHIGSPVANPAAVAVEGTYYAFIRDTSTACFSPASAAVTFTKKECCKAGKVAPVIN